MDIINRLVNSFVFWAAWIVIPLIMEVMPAIGSFFILLKRKIESGKVSKPIIYPEISIIVPVYNSQDTLAECIRSINDCIYPNDKIRVYLVNNQSKDDSFKIYQKCQELYPDLYIQWSNAEQGKSRALNLALYNSEGKYIIHIDSDGVLEKSALTYMVDKFEDNPKINCMTGAIMTRPDMIEQYPRGLSRLLRKLEFLEYAQAFLAGRNYASDINAIYTLSGAFSAFRKSAILKSQLYNTDTLAEDTQITFQMRYLQHDKIYISEKSIFFVDPIENVGKLYTQRQRWQRGSLEVSKMFIGEDMKARQLFKDVNVKTLMYDHTFAFPRMIWYLALICLMFIGYSAKTIFMSTLILFGIYTVCGYVYYLSTIGFLSDFKELRKYYIKQWLVIPLLPFFNLAVFFIRLAGIINSIDTNSSWKTRTINEEADDFKAVIKDGMKSHKSRIDKIRSLFNADPDEMYAEKTFSRKLKGSAIWYICIILISLLSVSFAVLCSWSHNTFTIGISEILNALFCPLEGSGGDTISRALKYCLPPIIAFAAAAAALVWLDRRAVRNAFSQVNENEMMKKGKPVLFMRRAASILTAVLLCSSIVYADHCYDIKGYIASRLKNSSIYEQYYIDPCDVSITAGDRTKNLIYIYVESMETTYASYNDGGFHDVNYIPNLTKLARENISFSNKNSSSELGGFYSTYGSTWTMAAMLTTTAGIPYDIPNSSAISDIKTVFSGVTALGDILKDNGYKNEFICGSDINFASRGDYLRWHGDYEIFDYYTAIDRDYISEDYFVWWGYEDEYLYRIARDEAVRLYENGEPFNLTILTVDTHFPDGYMCSQCSDEHPQTSENVVECADKQIYEFVEWLKTQPFYKDTVIVITGDHPRMDTSLVDNIDWYDRTVYNCFINAENTDGIISSGREFAAFDIFPSVLSAMGFEIEGDKLGLGTNLFSGQRTLVETLGKEKLEAHLKAKSDFYLKHFAPEYLGSAETKIDEECDIER